VDPQLITALITGSGVAGVFCVLFVLGRVFPKSVVDDKNAEIAELKAALSAERARADAAVTAASATKEILAAIQLGQHLGPARETT